MGGRGREGGSQQVSANGATQVKGNGKGGEGGSGWGRFHAGVVRAASGRNSLVPRAC